MPHILPTLGTPSLPAPGSHCYCALKFLSLLKPPRELKNQIAVIYSLARMSDISPKSSLKGILSFINRCRVTGVVARRPRILFWVLCVLSPGGVSPVLCLPGGSPPQPSQQPPLGDKGKSIPPHLALTLLLTEKCFVSKLQALPSPPRSEVRGGSRATGCSSHGGSKPHR